MQKSVVESDKLKIFWNFTLQTDNKIQARHSDRKILDLTSKESSIVDIVLSGDMNVTCKEKEKFVKYQDLARGMKKF